MEKYNDDEFWKALESRRGYTRTVNLNKLKKTQEQNAGNSLSSQTKETDNN